MIAISAKSMLGGNSKYLIFVTLIALGIVLAKPLLNAQDPGVGYLPVQESIGKAQAEKLGMWLYFGSGECSACLDVAEVFYRLQPDYQGQVAFIAVDVYDPNSEELIKKYGIKVIPTSLFVNGAGDITKAHVGVLTEDQARQFLEGR